jgi:pentatricopeptide repeat protein
LFAVPWIFSSLGPYIFYFLCRRHVRLLDDAFEQLRQLRQEGTPITTAALNTLLATAAERGEIHRVLSLLQEFERNDIKPDVDSYSFAFQSLGKNITREQHQQTCSDEHISACLVAADSFLASMETEDIPFDHHILREYCELLCAVGQVDVATSIVLETAKDDYELVNSKTIYKVALSNAKQQNFDLARQVARCRPDIEIYFIVKAVEREEVLHSYSSGHRNGTPKLFHTVVDLEDVSDD